MTLKVSFRKLLKSRTVSYKYAAASIAQASKWASCLQANRKYSWESGCNLLWRLFKVTGGRHVR